MTGSHRFYKILGWLRSLLGFAIAIALVVWVVQRGGVNPLEVLKKLGPGFLITLFLVYGVGVLLVILRWYWLLQHVKVFLSFMTAVRLSLIGLFFNLFVPGGVGGDLIKMVYLKREAGDRYPQALLTVLLDRVIGLAGLLALTVISIALNWNIIHNENRELRALLAVTGFTCLIGLGACSLFWAWPKIKSLGGDRIKGFKAKMRPGLVNVLDKLIDSFELMRAAPAKLFWLTLVAMAGHFTVVIVVVLAIKSIEPASSVSFASCLLAMQLANLASAVPLTPGGVGNRDLVLSLLLTLGGASHEVSGSIPLIVTFLMLAWSLVGGLVLILEKLGQSPKSSLEADAGMAGESSKLSG